MDIPSAACAAPRKNELAKKSASELFAKVSSAALLVVTNFVPFAKEFSPRRHEGFG
jgi:hypothetical protein